MSIYERLRVMKIHKVMKLFFVIYRPWSESEHIFLGNNYCHYKGDDFTEQRLRYGISNLWYRTLTKIAFESLLKKFDASKESAALDPIACVTGNPQICEYNHKDSNFPFISIISVSKWTVTPMTELEYNYYI